MEPKINSDLVNHPQHYISKTGLETIDVIEAFTFDLKGIEATDTGNIIKYICRWKNKNGLQDLKKARWYLDHLIEHVEKLEEENKKETRTDDLHRRILFPKDENDRNNATNELVEITMKKHKKGE